MKVWLCVNENEKDEAEFVRKKEPARKSGLLEPSKSSYFFVPSLTITMVEK